MLELLRKYQSYIFIVVSFVVIVSFSFFGTYNTIPADSIHEQILFTAIDGSQIKRSEVEEIASFLGTDNEDKMLYGGIWGPNFLNDGVIKNDFLATGLADILVQAYPSEVENDLEIRLAKEKGYRLYVHPQAKFLSAEGAWAYFAPEIKENYDALRKTSHATDPEAFAARTALFLSERKFPAPLLKQVLRYQQRQYQWVNPDPNLERADLSLFNYHTVEDWYGPRFVRLIAAFIINSSKIAEQKGYRVSKEEAIADLLRNADASFQQNIKNPNLGVTNSLEYFNEQLRRLGMDKNMTAKVWRQVLLFRRLFQDVGNAVFVDAMTHQQFAEYAKETAVGDLYRLPQELRFSNYRMLQKFEIYLDAIAKRSDPLLQLPSTLLSLDEIKKNTPALVQKKYELNVASIQKNELKAKVSLREMWEWEGEAANWEQLKTRFPELGITEANTRQKRLDALDHLDDATRSRVDAFAKAALVEEHPEWLESALSNAEAKPLTIGLNSIAIEDSSIKAPVFVKGLTDSAQLMKWLDQVPLNDQLPKNQQEDAAVEALAKFTADKNHYYRISVLKRYPHEELLTFAEADRQGLLHSFLDQKLEAYYLKNREKSSAAFQKEDQSWKPFAEVKDQVADKYFEKILKEISKDYAKGKGEKEKKLTGDQSASLRFFRVARLLKEKLLKGSDSASLVKESTPKLPDIKDQWKFEKMAFKMDRSMDGGDIDKEEIFALSPKELTPIHTPINGDLYLFQLQGKEALADTTTLYDKMNEAHQLLSYDAQRSYMHQFLSLLKAKNALTLNALAPASESMDKAGN